MRDVSERRKDRRRSVFLRAEVFAANGSPVTDCAIQDASRSGCRIISDDVDLIPDDIVLTIRGLGETFAGRVVWRRHSEAGVEFIPAE